MRKETTFLAFLVFLVASSVPAVADNKRPIVGAFGFDLAAAFGEHDPRVIEVTRRDEWGNWYKVLPEKGINGFTDYQVTVDHNGLILTIKAWGIPDQFRDARKLQDSLASMYDGHFQAEETEELQGGEMIYFYIKDRKEQATRVIALDYWYQEDKGVGWSLQYTDRALATENLNAEYKAIKTDKEEEANEEFGDIL